MADDTQPTEATPLPGNDIPTPSQAFSDAKQGLDMDSGPSEAAMQEAAASMGELYGGEDIDALEQAAAQSPEDDTPGEQEQEQEQPSEDRMWTLKVNGEEKVLPESEVKKLLQKQISADERFQQAAQLRKEAEAEKKAFLEDPLRYLQEHGGMTADQVNRLAEERIVKAIEQQSMTPEQRAEAYRREELAKQEREHQARQEQIRQHEVQQYQQNLEQSIGKVLEGQSLPATAQNIGLAAQILIAAEQSGIPVSEEDLGERVRSHMHEYTQSVLGKMDFEQKVALLGGDEFLKAMRERDIASLKEKKQPSRIKPQQARAQKRQEEAVSYDDLWIQMQDSFVGRRR